MRQLWSDSIANLIEIYARAPCGFEVSKLCALTEINPAMIELLDYNITVGKVDM